MQLDEKVVQTLKRSMANWNGSKDIAGVLNVMKALWHLMQLLPWIDAGAWDDDCEQCFLKVQKVAQEWLQIIQERFPEFEPSAVTGVPYYLSKETLDEKSLFVVMGILERWQATGYKFFFVLAHKAGMPTATDTTEHLLGKSIATDAIDWWSRHMDKQNENSTSL